MSKQDHLPTEAASQTARRIGWSVVCAIFLLPVGLRAYAALLLHQITPIVHGMAQLKPGQTTNTEMLTLIPKMRPTPPDPPGYVVCRAPECYSLKLGNTPSRFAQRFLSEMWSTEILRALGLRYWSFSAVVGLKDGKVRGFTYTLRLDDGFVSYPAGTYLRGRYLRPVAATVVSVREDGSDYPEPLSSAYRAWGSSNYGDGAIRVAFTPAATPEQVRHAFSVHLACVWSLLGCKAGSQVLSEAWADSAGNR